MLRRTDFLRTGRVILDYATSAIPILGVAIVFLIAWHFGVKISKVPPVLLPTPLQVLDAARENRESLIEATLVTAKAAATGLVTSVIAGVFVSLVFSQSRHIRNALYPYVIFLQTVPIIAIAPLLITWTGYTFKTVVYVTVIISLFPIISNVTAGLVAIDRNLEDLFRVYKASRWQVMLRLRIPTAVAYLVLGLRISSGLAVIGAIVGDFFVGTGGESNGLGTLMTSWGARQKTDAVIAAVAASTFVGVVFFGGVNLMANTVFSRWIRK